MRLCNFQLIHRIRNDLTKLPFTSQEGYYVLGYWKEEPDYQNSLGTFVVKVQKCQDYFNNLAPLAGYQGITGFWTNEKEATKH
jgi:hypothetical protein